ncbi:hypothetical protein, partial [Hymenobacter glacialis]|uniref:hypothetical protein n=1 Tax=Hymenobacter glacialis TaxID=1908236 RepID=UPI0019D3E046
MACWTNGSATAPCPLAHQTGYPLLLVPQRPHGHRVACWTNGSATAPCPLAHQTGYPLLLVPQ